MSNLKEILQNLGFRLKDHGSYWSSNAAFRDGDNPTAIKIYKDSGVWKDFVEDTVYLPIEALIEKSAGSQDALSIRQLLKRKDNFLFETSRQQSKLLQEEKSFSLNCLEKLLPHYESYQKINPNISQTTLEKFRGGLATSGKMYRRFVFPVLRSDGRIHGFSGRIVAENFNGPKWLHMGKKNNWFYPYFSITDVALNISSAKSVHIVESIGDCLNLYEHGIKNVLVSFGLNLSPKFIGRLSNIGAERIFVSFNNDFESEKNRGFHGAVKSIFKLIGTLDFQSVFFVPPHKNDFGVMDSDDISAYKKQCEEHDHQKSCELVMATAQIIKQQSDTHNASFDKSLRYFKKLYKFHYE